MLSLQQVDLDQVPKLVAVSGDGTKAVVAGEKVLQIVDLGAGAVTQRIELNAGVADVDISKTGRTVAVAHGQPDISVFDTSTGRQIQKLHRRDAPDFMRSDGQERLGIFSSGTKVVSTGSRRRVYVSLVDSGNWETIMFMKPAKAKPIVSPDDRFVALLGPPNPSEISGHVSMFRVNRGLQPLWTKWHDGNAPVITATFSADSSRLASCGPSDGIRIWDVSDGSEIANLHHQSQTFLGATFVADSELLIAMSSSEFQIWDFEKVKMIDSHKSSLPLKTCSASDDGHVLATLSGDRSVSIWKVKTSQNQPTGM